jgi:hypothetical protein
VFKREAEMLPPVARWMQQERLLTKAELLTPSGPCDLVGVRFWPDQVKLRLSNRQTRPIASLTRAVILQMIPDVADSRSIRLASIAKAFEGMLPAEAILAEVERLVRDRFVVRRGTLLQKINGWVPLHERIVAVELKLTRIEDVLSQAKCHLSFADESYVGLPEDVAARVESRASRWDRYWQLGIGLLAVSNSRCRVVRPSHPSVVSQDQALRMYMADKFWTRRSETVHH